MKKTSHTTILTEAELNQFSQQLLTNDAIQWIAIDTEFVRTDTYFSELSLVQIQDNLGQATLIDPLAILENGSLTGLIDLLTAPGLLKVFHSARQDIEVLYQLAQKMPVSIYDTQIAAVFFKHGDIAGFARVVEAELGHKLPKSQTRTNWHARPLTNEQIEYALDDVRYLAPLYEKQIKQLTAEQLTAIQADCEALLDESLYKPDPSSAGNKVKGIRNFKPKQLAIVNALAEWRELFAIEHNQPKKWVMSDEVIIGIAKRPPKTADALYKVPHVKSSSVRDYGQQWIDCIDQVFESSPDSWPQPAPKETPPSAQEAILINFSQTLCQQVALDYKINLHNLIQKQELVKLIRNPQQSILSGWRSLLIEQPLQTLFKEQSSLKIQHGKLFLRSHD
ncbi:MAG: HRDC domain-containing protein [Pseudomonadota bacterium]|nr:HRDC domain-containing protein [Pseudomonadota bacterium]